MFICGINTSSDDDHSILAFTDQPGNSNNWGDSWRGNNQYGTIWSLFNDDYSTSCIRALVFLVMRTRTSIFETKVVGRFFE